MVARLALLPLVCSVVYAAEPAIPVQVKVEQQTSVILPSNPTTGFGWQLAEPLSSQSPVVVEFSFLSHEAKKPLCGAPCATKVTFIGKQTGTATVRLIYARPWEKDTPPAQETTFRVTVSR